MEQAEAGKGKVFYDIGNTPELSEESGERSADENAAAPAFARRPQVSPRVNWPVGSAVEVYSNSDRRWNIGCILKEDAQGFQVQFVDPDRASAPGPPQIGVKTVGRADGSLAPVGTSVRRPPGGFQACSDGAFVHAHGRCSSLQESWEYYFQACMPNIQAALASLAGPHQNGSITMRGPVPQPCAVVAQTPAPMAGQPLHAPRGVETPGIPQTPGASAHAVAGLRQELEQARHELEQTRRLHAQEVECWRAHLQEVQQDKERALEHMNMQLQEYRLRMEEAERQLAGEATGRKSISSPRERRRSAEKDTVLNIEVMVPLAAPDAAAGADQAEENRRRMRAVQSVPSLQQAGEVVRMPSAPVPPTVPHGHDRLAQPPQTHRPTVGVAVMTAHQQQHTHQGGPPLPPQPQSPHLAPQAPLAQQPGQQVQHSLQQALQVPLQHQGQAGPQPTPQPVGTYPGAWAAASGGQAGRHAVPHAPPWYYGQAVVAAPMGIVRRAGGF